MLPFALSTDPHERMSERAWLGETHRIWEGRASGLGWKTAQNALFVRHRPPSMCGRAPGVKSPHAPGASPLLSPRAGIKFLFLFLFIRSFAGAWRCQWAVQRERERESLAREFYLKNPTPPGAAHAA